MITFQKTGAGTPNWKINSSLKGKKVEQLFDLVRRAVSEDEESREGSLEFLNNLSIYFRVINII